MLNKENSGLQGILKKQWRIKSTVEDPLKCFSFWSVFLMKIFLGILPMYFKNAATKTKLKPVVQTSVDWGARWSKAFSSPSVLLEEAKPVSWLKVVKEDFLMFWDGGWGEFYKLGE